MNQLNTCGTCKQADTGQTGEYPCPECGLPTTHDEKELVLLPHERQLITEARLGHVMWTIDNPGGQVGTTQDLPEFIVNDPRMASGVNVMQLQVRDFMAKMRQHIESEIAHPPPETRLLRYRLIMQEAFECAEAILDSDMDKAVDGMCDLLYVVFGAAEAHGINLQPYFNEVHRTNMLKDPDCMDEYGKVQKPVGWQPPQIAKMLTEAGYPERPAWACQCVERITGSWVHLPMGRMVPYWGDDKFSSLMECRACGGDGGIGKHRAAGG